MCGTDMRHRVNSTAVCVLLQWNYQIDFVDMDTEHFGYNQQ